MSSWALFSAVLASALASGLRRRIVQCSLAKLVAKHGKAALGLLAGGFVLNHIPMLYEDSILYSKNVGCDPVHGLSEARKSPVHDHEISLSHDGSRFVFQRWRDALDKVEKTVAAGCDMSAVLDVVARPIALSRGVVPLVKQRVESFKYKRFIFRFNRLIHCCPSNICI